jgi:hypothetical protein
MKAFLRYELDLEPIIHEDVLQLVYLYEEDVSLLYDSKLYYMKIKRKKCVR